MIEIRKSTQAELTQLEIDAMDFQAVETVPVDNKVVGSFVTSEDGWGCQYFDKGSNQVIDFGNIDYDLAKSRLIRMIEGVYK